MKIDIHESIKHVNPNCSLGYLIVRNIKAQGMPPAFVQEFFQLQAAVAKRYKLDVLNSIPAIGNTWNVYKKIDFSIPEYRQSAEELVRRVLENKGAYYVNSAVDVHNYCSLKFLLPFGVYDFDQIDGDITYRIATEANYINIAGNNVNTDAKPFLCDAKGVFGNAISDARRTAVTLATSNILSVVYADEEVTNDELTSALKFTGEMIVNYCGGIVETQGIIEL